MYPVDIRPSLVAEKPAYSVMEEATPEKLILSENGELGLGETPIHQSILWFSIEQLQFLR